jgi:predicted transcriptional regulator
MIKSHEDMHKVLNNIYTRMECRPLLNNVIIKLLENDPGQPVKDLAKKLGLNRTFLAGYLKALENQDYIKLKKIGPAKVYFSNKKGI